MQTPGAALKDGNAIHLAAFSVLGDVANVRFANGNVWSVYSEKEQKTPLNSS